MFGFFFFPSRAPSPIERNFLQKNIRKYSINQNCYYTPEAIQIVLPSIFIINEES